MPGVWSHILTDNQGNAIAELENLHTRTLYLPLSRIATGSFVIDTINPQIANCMGLDLMHVKVYRETPEAGKILMANGPLVPSLQKSVSDQTKQMTVNFAGIGWRLGRRIIEETKTADGYTYGWPLVTSLTTGALVGMDRVAMILQIINNLNSAPPPDPTLPQSVMDTGIRVGAYIPDPEGEFTTIGPWFYKNALQGILEISSTLTAPDWVILPIEPTVTHPPELEGLAFGRISILPIFGGVRPNCVWEFGDGKRNVASFTQTNDATVLMNRGYSLPSGFPNAVTDEDGAGVISNYDLASIVARNQIYEDQVTADLTTTVARTAILNQSLLIQKQPKTVITFQPTTDPTPGVVPQFGEDWGLGDVVQFRAVEYGVETVNALFRIYGVTFVVDDEGNEIPTPVLISQDDI